ncbi:MAG: HdeD family acid-resistance protein [Chloroflexi bacterium]|nr:MAG: HdeD family acid-resistance protein [Chloroflexota bacterium]
MGRTFAVSWLPLAIRGVAGILLGIAAFAWTGLTLLVLITLFGAYLLVDGLFALIAGVRGGSWLVGVEGLLGIVAGGLVIWRPGIAAIALVYLIALWAVLTGAAELGAAYLLRRILPSEWLLVIAGIVSILFGVLLAINPSAGLVTITWLFGAYMIVFGALALALGFRLRGSRATLVVGSIN